jgi:uncharacterized protein (TIGR03067 family)
MSRLTVAFVLVAAPLAAADPPKELQGGWRLVAVETEAGPTELPDAKPGLVIQGDTVRHAGKEIARLTADPAADPKVIDFKFTDPERTYEGVYTIEKDTLKLCLNGRSAGVKERPTGFALDGHPTWRRLTLERVKPADAGPGPAFVGLVLKFEEATKEVVVQAALDGSPAKAAGLKKDDVLLAVGGSAADSLKGAVDRVRAGKPGDELVLKVRRAGKDLEVKLKPTVVPFAGLVGLD